jgi:hypothetical protein
VLGVEIAQRAREIIGQICTAREITIVQGHVSADHIHLLVSCPQELSQAKIAQYLKGISPRKLQDEFPHLKKRYWGSICGSVVTSARPLALSPKSRLLDLDGPLPETYKGYHVMVWKGVKNSCGYCTMAFDG